MLFQEGFDVGVILFPLLFVVGLCLLGLVIWLISILTKAKNEPSTQPVEPPTADDQSKAPPYILAVGQTGSEWEIFIKGRRVDADTSITNIERKEALDALRVLARYARDRLRVEAEPVHSIPESATQKTHTQSESISGLTSSAVDNTPASISQPQPHLGEPADYPSPTTGIPGMNLAQEISEIVDEMLTNTPSLQNHAVDLLNAQANGIHFVVDGVVYKAVEDIPNPEIRDLIRKATKEWERR
jgi:hypothetical protein